MSWVEKFLKINEQEGGTSIRDWRAGGTLSWGEGEK